MAAWPRFVDGRVFAGCMIASCAAAGDPAIPWIVTEPGYVIEVAATDLQLPSCVAFVPNPGESADSPLCYIVELYGTIKVLSRDGTLSDYATGLLNFNPTGNFPGSGEKGIGGIAVHAATGDVYATLVYSSNPSDGNAPFYPKVIRLTSADGGRTASAVGTVLDMFGAEQAESHQVSSISFGPHDGMLYVHNGDGAFPLWAVELDKFVGKVLRMQLDGSPPSDNPFYNAADGIGPADYVWAYGFRNPFGGAWRASDGLRYGVDNGPTVDRFMRIDAGVGYGWAGNNQQMYQRALYNWVPSHAPVAVAFVEPETFGGSGFPPWKQDKAFVTESGPTWTSGYEIEGKRIVQFDVAPGGASSSEPCPFVQYVGSGKATVAGLAAGPDGLYFTDLYKDADYVTPIDRGANLYRVRHVGASAGTATPYRGPAPLDVRFEMGAIHPPPASWLWSFGDGATSTDRDPVHRYESEGSYIATLTTTRPDGMEHEPASFRIDVAAQTNGFLGTYHHGVSFCGDPVIERIDAAIDFNWGAGGPGATLPANGFIVRWQGTVVPQFSETYGFIARTDDGVRLRVKGQTLVDHWFEQGATDRGGNIALTAGVPVEVEMEYFEAAGSASARLSWQSPSLPREVIPASRSTPPTDAEVLLDGAIASIMDGTPFAVDFGVRCNGPSGAENLLVELTFDPAIQILGIEPPDASATTGPGSVSLDAGSLPSGGSATVRVHLLGNAAEVARFAVMAAVSTTSMDRAPANDEAVLDGKVMALPDGESALWIVD